MRRNSQNSSPLPGIAEWLTDLAIWIVARSLQMPAPLVHAIAAFVYASMQEADRRLIALCRPSR